MNLIFESSECLFMYKLLDSLLICGSSLSCSFAIEKVAADD